MSENGQTHFKNLAANANKGLILLKRYSQEKSTLKLNSSAYEKYEYWHLGHWCIKLTLFKRF